MSKNVESSYQQLANEVGELVRIGRETLEILANARGSVEEAKSAAISELIAQAEDLQSDLMVSAYDYEARGVPSKTLNPKRENARYLDLNTGAVYVCKDRTENENVWITWGSEEIKKMERALSEMRAEIEACGIAYKRDENPNESVNPAKVGALWLNTKTSTLFTCEDNAFNKNVWIGGNRAIGGSKGEILADEVGFGGGIPSDEALLRLGLEKLSGSENPESMEWSQYVHSATGSVMCYAPKMYHKLSFVAGAPYYGLKVEFSKERKAGFTLNRSFYNGGREIEGFFTDKFHNSLKNGKAVSVKGGVALSAHANYNPISQCTAGGVTPTNNQGGCIDAARSRGNEFFLMPVWVRWYWVFLMLAKYQKLFEKGDLSPIAWCDMEPHIPRGDNNSSLKDEFDLSVVYQSAGDGRGGKTGGVSGDLNLKKISILGDGTSPCDFNGVMFDVCLGNSGSATQIGILKKSVDIRSLTSANAHNPSNYHFFDSVTGLQENGSYPRCGYGDGNSPVLHCATQEDTKEWWNDMLLRPKAFYPNSPQTLFGGDTCYNRPVQDSMIHIGHGWSSIANYGAFYACSHYDAAYSSHNLGLRACALG